MSRPAEEGREVAAAFRGELVRLVRRRLAGEADAEDVVQDVMLRLLRSPERIPSDEGVSAWLQRVVANASVDHYRRKATQTRVLDRYQSEVQTGLAPAREAEGEVHEDLARCVRPLLALLSAEDQQALELTDLGGRSQQEAAAEIGIGYSAMKSRVQRARKRLHTAFLDCCREECERIC